MESTRVTPFEDTESAHEYLTLLRRAVLDSRDTIEADLHEQNTCGLPRRVEAFRLVIYKIYKLDRPEEHVKICRRLLNDLRSMRRLLENEKQPRSITVETVIVTEASSKRWGLS